MSSSRRLDISSLLCTDVPDPVILAPHLRKQQPGNLQYLGLDALVHAASQERSRRLDDRHWHTVLDISPHTTPQPDSADQLRTDSHFPPDTRRLSGPGILPLDIPRQWSPHQSPVVAPPTPPAPSSPGPSPAEDLAKEPIVQTAVEVDDAPPAPIKVQPPDPAPVPSPSSFVFPSDMLSSAFPVVSALTPERGSMPPPASTTSARSEISLPKQERAGSVTVAPRKKKETVAKAPAKPKQPAKPRAKPKPKLKIVPDAAKSAKIGTALAKRSVPGASRSRSTSVMPGGSVGPEGDAKMDVDEAQAEADDEEDDKLYCVCKTRYDDDKVMIACDICDGWYHTQCVQMPDLEVDLVDQFICPPCIGKHPEDCLQTTYKRRCLVGLKHHDPASAEACHKPARGAFSKYCSDECGVNHMEANIEAWSKNGGKKERLWESVKGAEKREGVVVCADPPKDAVAKTEVADAAPKKGKVEREVQRLNAQLDEVVRVREKVKKDMEVVLWRRRLLELAVERAETVDQCGWDQRLCFGDEWADFGAGVLESYEAGDDTMHVDGAADDEGAWWCVGKKKCERHVGWQALRAKDVAHEAEKEEESLLKLTTEEREIRKRIEDMVEHGRNSNDSPSTALMEASNIKPRNGEQGKKGKKRKAHS